MKSISRLAGLEEPTMADTKKRIAEIREALEKIDRGDLFEIAMAHEKSGEWLRFLLDELERLERLNEILQEEIQRLRTALEEVRECLDDFWDHDTPRRLYKEVRRFAGQINVMEKVINQALSTAIEPTNAANARFEGRGKG